MLVRCWAEVRDIWKLNGFIQCACFQRFSWSSLSTAASLHLLGSVRRHQKTPRAKSVFAEPEFNEAYLNNSYRDRRNDQRGERLVVDRSIFSQHVDPLRFSETRDLQHHRTWTHTRTHTL